MVFNADDVAASLTPPTFVIGGQTYTGKILSLLEVIALKKEFENLPTDGDNLEQAVATLEKVCGAMGIEANTLFALPMPVIRKAVAHFFASVIGSATQPT